jgi:hypothetical protein
VPKLYLPHNMTLTVDDQEDLSTISDGHYSFADLYRSQALLVCHLLAQDTHGWKSWLTDHDTDRPGWFFAGTHVWCPPPAAGGTYVQMEEIFYCLPAHYWDLCHVTERARAPVWDGQTSADVCDRLERALLEAR